MRMSRLKFEKRPQNVCVWNFSKVKKTLRSEKNISREQRCVYHSDITEYVRPKCNFLAYPKHIHVGTYILIKKVTRTFQAQIF